MPAHPNRDELIDALRGLALFGILAVNIQSFVWGYAGPTLGVLAAGGRPLDQASIFLTALLFEFKMAPIFWFCFGYGFWVQTRRWRLGGQDPKRRFARRMHFLLLLGGLHGVLLYFGDILSRYALAGYALRRHIGKGPKALLKSTRFWLGLHIAFCLAAVALTAALPLTGAESAKAAADTKMAVERNFAAYASSTYAQATAQRASDFLAMTRDFLFTLPLVMVFFLVGAITAQCGWLRDPARFRPLWRRVLRWGLGVGVPTNLAHAFFQVAAAHDPGRQAGWLEVLVGWCFIPALSLAYVAAFALASDSAACRGCVRLLAPAGRVALSAYIVESLAMTLLLSGSGLALGLSWGPFDLLLASLAIYGLLLAAAHRMRRLGLQGPLERLWRRHTSGG